MELIFASIVTTFLKLLIVVIVLDCILGTLRAIKEHCFNSCIGIDGLIRKFAMLSTAIGTKIIDNIVKVNLIGFIPEEIRNFIHFDYAGISELFILLFIIYEALSILKNLTRLEIPIFKNSQKWLKNFLSKYTDENIEAESNKENK